MSRIFAAGSLLTLEQGCYSDKQWAGPFRVLKEIEVEAVEAEFRAQWKADEETLKWDDNPKPDPDDFIAWLNFAGYIEDVDGSTSWYLGDYQLEPGP